MTMMIILLERELCAIRFSFDRRPAFDLDYILSLVESSSMHIQFNPGDQSDQQLDQLKGKFRRFVKTDSRH